tara:strand:+ start:473 stop:3142 length:2670 start_codon:yes stop_codon:yes gene_type:complete
MYRAVKVVSREDFEYERTFEREFEGIQRYEQVSKDHPGLVDVLHVGRDDEAGYYYYVMELADDEGGHQEEIDPETYKAKTLTSELRRNGGMSVLETVRLGISLANALGHLHQSGLTHRDVKPSNIIFVKGAPKLADVGLVAATGQRTFVGTEGYVPPEGPGTSSADLYSLAMVLYEVHTSKDRLDFPELPTNLEISPTVNRDEWRALNNAICRAGSPDVKKRYSSAQSLARALHDVVSSGTGSGRNGSRSSRSKAAVTLLLIGLFVVAGGGGYWVWKDGEQFKDKNSDLISQKEKAKEGEPDSIVISETDGEPNNTVSGIEIVDPGKEEGQATDGPTFTIIDLEKGNEIGDDEVVIKDEVTTDVDLTGDGEGMKGGDKVDSGVKNEPVKDDVTAIAEVVKGRVNLVSTPSGAIVWVDGEEVGTTPRPLEFPVGSVEIVLKYFGYFDYVHSGDVEEGFQIANITLVPDRRPAPGTEWVNSTGIAFIPDTEVGFISSESAPGQLFNAFMEETGMRIPVVSPFGIVQVRDESAQWAFCDWVTRKDRESGYLGEVQYYRPVPGAESLSDDSFKLVMDDKVGTLILNSEPTGALVVCDGVSYGRTPVVLSDIRQGTHQIQLEYPGYKITKKDLVLTEVEAVPMTISLQRDTSVVFGNPWTNSQGMQMVPIGDVMVAAYETQVRDYREYVTEMQILMPASEIPQALNHPVVGVTRNEAEAFCEWLTLRERFQNRIRETQRYRLPGDLEWSLWAGIDSESGADPEIRGRLGAQQFFWGGQWPPAQGSGNFGDLAAVGALRNYVIQGYNDGYATTAPGGSFAVGPHGLYDLAGNVWEWVQDSYQKGDDSLGVTRGGGWNTYERDRLSISYRNAVPAEAREDFYGFRYVLEEVTGLEP